MPTKFKLVRSRSESRQRCDVCARAVRAVMQLSINSESRVGVCSDCLRKALNVIDRHHDDIREDNLTSSTNAVELLLAQTGGKLQLSLTETCELLGMRPSTGYNMICQARFPIAGSKRGHTWTFDVREVGAYLDAERERGRLDHERLAAKMNHRR
jgi:predicted DNA-binding transcriptional regulator AlpA